jgi:ribosomal protein S18 acetylase RimI-like enzyme
VAHILDNPIWQALCSGNRALSAGTGSVKYIERNTGLFAAMQRYSNKGFNTLHQLLPNDSSVILFTAKEISMPVNWIVEVERPLLQMVYRRRKPLQFDAGGIKKLSDKNVPAMLALTALTNPGPFLKRTIDMGNYEGVFKGRKLVAMTGRRLQPGQYIEVSAVCTHPEHTGMGYAAQLVCSQVNSIVAEGKLPFLHVFPENTAACRLYEKLGFIARKQLMVYFLTKAV